MTLDKLGKGESAVIVKVGGQGELRQHFLDMGVIPGQTLTLTKFAPLGDPMELLINGYSLTLRLADAAEIEIEKLDAAPGLDADVGVPIEDEDEHPGFGEEGRFHSRKDENPLPKGTVLTFALAGNQNCGKTTLFNQLTGANQHVGNFPGVTVDRKDGVIRGHQDTRPAGNLFAFPLHLRGDSVQEFHPGGEAQGDNQHSRRRQYREEPLSDHAIAGAERPHGAGAQYDG